MKNSIKQIVTVLMVLVAMCPQWLWADNAYFDVTIAKKDDNTATISQENASLVTIHISEAGAPQVSVQCGTVSGTPTTLSDFTRYNIALYRVSTDCINPGEGDLEGDIVANAPMHRNVAQPSTLTSTALVLEGAAGSPFYLDAEHSSITLALSDDGKYVVNGAAVEGTVNAIYFYCDHHSPMAHPAVAPACTTTGNSAYWSCLTCNKYFSDEACTNEIEEDSCVVAATGHDLVDGQCTHNCGFKVGSYRVPVYKTDDAGNQDAKLGIAMWCTQEHTGSLIQVNSSDEQVTWEAGWYYVLGTVNLTKGAVCNGAVHLILCDNAKLTITNSTKKEAGIFVNGSNSLTIYAQSEGIQMGELLVTGGEDGGAGIGGAGSGSNDRRNGENITINGGKVTAKCGPTVYDSSNDYGGGAGIGGGRNGLGQYITINGGMVTANGAYYAAGIGGGGQKRCQYITINGGTVIATGGWMGAGIGSGQWSDVNDIYINGGEITATGGDYDNEYITSGIGRGGRSDNSKSKNIFISNALITKAGTSETPTTVIDNNGGDLASSLWKKRYATVHQHQYTSPVWTWADDGSEATLRLTCMSDLKQIECNTKTNPAVTITSSTTDDAFCENGGVVTFHASVVVDGITYTAPAKEVHVSAGHQYGEPVWTWADDGSNATLTFTCRIDLAQLVYTTTTTPAVVITSTSLAATCASEGNVTYHASAVIDGIIYHAPALIFRIEPHFFAENDETHSVCTRCNHGFFRYSATERVVPPHSKNLLDKDGNRVYMESRNTFNETTKEGVMELSAPLVTIGDSVFWCCTNLTGNLSIPNSVESIGNEAFKNCYYLTGNLTIPNSVKSIGAEAFINCWELSGSLTIPNSVKSIGAGAFNGCIGLSGSLTIPNSVESIGAGAFYDCENLTGSLTIPNSVESIGAGAFINCEKLTGSLTIPNSVKSIGAGAFKGCIGLSGSLTIGNSVESIGAEAFGSVNFNGECDNFSSIELRSIPYIGSTSVKNYVDSLFYDRSGFELFIDKNIPIHLVVNEDSYVSSDKGCFPRLTSLTYNRTFGGTNWTTWYVPFELELTSEICTKYDFSRINNVHQYEKETGDVDKTIIESFRLNQGATLKANYPYLVRVKSDANKAMSITLNDVTLGSATDNGIFCQSVDTRYTFTGTYTGLDYGSDASTEYSLFDDDTNGWERFCRLKPQRHYLAVTSRDDSAGNDATGSTTTTMDTYALADGAEYNQEEAYVVGTLTYTRTFGNTYWTTWYVPFAFTLTDEICAKYDFSRINNVHQYDDNNDGVADRTVIESFRQKSGKTLKANYPYLVRAKSDADKAMTLTLTDVTLAKAEVNSIDCQSIDTKYTFTGTYQEVAGDDNKYTLSTKGTWNRFRGYTLKPQRHYLTITSLNNSTSNNAPEYVSLNVVGEEDATGIVTIYGDEEVRRFDDDSGSDRGVYLENGRIVIVRNGRKYNISGQIIK